MGLLSFYKQPQPRGYDKRDYLIEDLSASSEDYFRVTDLPSVVGGGKSLIKLKGNGPNLRRNTTIDVEVIDAAGNNMYAVVLDYTDRFDNYYIALEVYDQTPRGLATIHLVGEAVYDYPKFNQELEQLENQIETLSTQRDDTIQQLQQLQNSYITLKDNVDRITRAREQRRSARQSVEVLVKREADRIAQILANGSQDFLENFFSDAQVRERERLKQKYNEDLKRFQQQIIAIEKELIPRAKKLNTIQNRLQQLDIEANRLQNEIINLQEELNELEPERLPPGPDPIGPNYNVHWTAAINIVPMERNTADLVFDEPPQVNIVQVTTPEREYVASTTTGGTGSVYSNYTSSRTDYEIVTANFKGYDRDFGSGKDILDVRLQNLLLNPLQKPSTNNSVNSSIRKQDDDIQGGFERELTSRFNTVVTSNDRTIQKDFLGGDFTFFVSSSDEVFTPTENSPTLPSNFTVSGSDSPPGKALDDQLKPFDASIIEVMTDTQMRISKGIEVVTLNSEDKRIGYTTKQKFKKSSNFVGNITYLPSDAAFVTSSTVSQSYLETTFSDLKPIGGEVYRIKTYFKKGTSTGDFKLIYDAVVNPVEYLTDAQYPNQTTYAKRESDFRLIGHFTADEIVNLYWTFMEETPTQIYPGIVPTINSSSLHESIPITCEFTQSGLLTTQFDQNYTTDQIYTLSFNVTIDPGTELELYMSSDPLSTNVTLPQAFTRAFIKDANLDKTRYQSSVSRFGKFVGRIKNNRSISKYYGKVEFDFATDASGLGKPIFRTKTIDYADTSGTAYVSEISIKPVAINGFTPNIVQYQIPFNNEIESLLAVSQSIDFKIEYFDFTGKQSEFVTYINDLLVNVKTDIPSNVCQDTKFDFLIGNGIESGSLPT